jgi:hypothetical protein
MLIRLAKKEDEPAVWSIIEPTIRAGETYALSRDMSKANALSYWMGSDRAGSAAPRRHVVYADTSVVDDELLRAFPCAMRHHPGHGPSHMQVLRIGQLGWHS